MAGLRVDLQTILEGILGSGAVYFQPPENVNMTYPAIVYQRDFRVTEHADNAPYFHNWRYMITVIDQNPDSQYIDKVGALPKSKFVRHFAVAGLNHDIFDVYF